MKKIIFVMFAILANNVFAADGSSGCGPGWYLFKENSLVSSSFRATTNGILFPVVTIGMTVGSSNCSQHKIVQKEKESLHFVTQNYYELKGQTARGNGEYIAAFSHTLGCSPVAADLLGQKMKQNYKVIFQDNKTSDEETLLQIYNTIFSDSTLAKSCLAEVV